MNFYADAATATAIATHIATPTSSFATITTTNALSLLRVPGRTATLPLLLLTSFAAAATAIAYADANVARVALLTVFNVTCCCYRNRYDANCYYERVIASTRARINCYAASATATSFATITTANASADAGVARVALLQCLN